MFRFTLGIPGFDDEDVPRVVGALGAAGLFANKIVAGTDGASEALGRSETVGAALCLACAIAPELGRALKGESEEEEDGEQRDGGRSRPGTRCSPWMKTRAKRRERIARGCRTRC